MIQKDNINNIEFMPEQLEDMNAEITYEMPKKQRKMKTTHCRWCNKEIIQGKKEGIMLCEECAEKYIQLITNWATKIATASECERVNVRLGNATFCGNHSDKNTVITLEPFRGISYFSTWIDTETILKLIENESQYIDKYIEHNIEASYYFVTSLGEHKRALIKQEQEQQRELVKALIPQYRAGEITLKEFSKQVALSKPKIERLIEEIEEGENND